MVYDYGAQRDRIAQQMTGGGLPAWMAQQTHAAGTPMDAGTGGQPGGAMAGMGPFESWYKGSMSGTPTNMMPQLPTSSQPMTPDQPLGQTAQPQNTASEQMLTGAPASPMGMIGQAGWGAPPSMQRSQPVTGTLQVTGSLGTGGIPSPAGGKGQGVTPPNFGG